MLFTYHDYSYSKGYTGYIVCNRQADNRYLLVEKPSIFMFLKIEQLS